jgi:hypothetical protein
MKIPSNVHRSSVVKKICKLYFCNTILMYVCEQFYIYQHSKLTHYLISLNIFIVELLTFIEQQESWYFLCQY